MRVIFIYLCKLFFLEFNVLKGEKYFFFFCFGMVFFIGYFNFRNFFNCIFYCFSKVFVCIRIKVFILCFVIRLMVVMVLLKVVVLFRIF